MTPQQYEQLIKPLPKEAFHKFTKEETGYETDIISHNYQYAVNRMNEVLGTDGWFIKEDDVSSIEKNGLYEVVKKIRVGILERRSDNTQSEKWSERWSYGGGVSKLLADAHKSAVTNGLKKALAFYGVGKETYEQSIDDDFLEKIKVDNKVNAVDEVKEIKKKIMNCATSEELQKTKSLIEKSRLETKDKTVLVNLFNTKLQSFNS